jgi:hypothetical protein
MDKERVSATNRRQQGDLHDVDKRQNAEDEEAPLVRCRDERARESGDNRDENHEYDEEEIGQWKAGREQ